ncbi:MAG: YraN family protein [Pseudomonadales bacterium]
MFGRWLTDNGTHTQTRGHATGAQIEQRACQWLEQQGLDYIESNYRCRVGEIDLVMLDQQQLVFVEVRYRKQNSFGSAAESVDWRKQKKLQKTAAHYLVHRPKHIKRACRFDVLAAQPGKQYNTLRWCWIKDAFTD